MLLIDVFLKHTRSETGRTDHVMNDIEARGAMKGSQRVARERNHKRERVPFVLCYQMFSVMPPLGGSIREASCTSTSEAFIYSL